MPQEHEPKRFLVEFGRRLRSLRTQRGWTLEEAEEHGKIAWRHLQKIEAGKNITIATLIKIAKMFKVHPSKLLEDL